MPQSGVDLVKTFRPLLCSATLFAAANPAFGQTVASAVTVSYTVSGRVTDANGSPIEKAEVSLLSGGKKRQTGVSGFDGRFTLGDFSAGNAKLEIRHIGYEERSMNISIGVTKQPTFVEVLLYELPQKLEEVMVVADAQGRLRDFDEHKKARNNFGRYFDRAEIRKRNPSFASELFRTIPAVQVQASSFGGNLVRVRGCKPLLWMDGQKIPGAELDEVVRPFDIAGIEFYPSNAGIPAEYMDRNNASCGIIVVWTKSQ